TLASSVTSQGSTSFEPIPAASGSTRFLMAAPWAGSAISAPWSRQPLVMPQAIARVLATPKTTPRVPAINLAASAIYPPAWTRRRFICERPLARKAFPPALLHPPNKGWAGSLLRPGRMNPKLAGKRPATAWLAAGNALNLTHEGAERQRIGEVAAYPALVSAK